MYIYQPYTYLIGWSTHNKWYYGVRFSSKATPEDLWKTYFTSSKYVKEFRYIFGEPDVIQIRKIFKCAAEARLWENRILKKLKVVHDTKWLNRTDNCSISAENSLKGSTKQKSLEMRKKLSESKKGKVLSTETKLKISDSTRGKVGYWKDKHLSNSTKEKLSTHGKKLVGDKNPFYGKSHTEETKKKISESRKNKNIGIQHPLYGRPRSEETKKKIRDAKKLKKLNIQNNNNNNILIEGV
jgi:hypothetical protein